MRAVVTGGAGFIGSHLIEALVQRGDEVVCVERPGASRRWLDGLDVCYRDSGLEDVSELTAALAGADVVFHLAGLTEARAPQDFYAVNTRSEEHTSELQSLAYLVCRLLLEKKKKNNVIRSCVNY